jgi:hypothetical protein
MKISPLMNTDDTDQKLAYFTARYKPAIANV